MWVLMQVMLEATVKKMKYDKSYNFEHEVSNRDEWLLVQVE